ncbi:hypothetical protein HanPI659440_Chr17g0691891 [Helianthus annuus]|nr:hypothetical protein HanPI659440_Chr17g0691891 [Helianthus annuus]
MCEQCLCLSKDCHLYKDKFVLVALTHLEVGTLIHLFVMKIIALRFHHIIDVYINPYMDFIGLQTKFFLTFSLDLSGCFMNM